MKSLRTQSEAARIIFIPFIDAFGGAERLILDLSRFLYESDIAHLITCFRQKIDLQRYADWPLQVHQIRPKRNPAIEAIALHRFLRREQRSATNLPLLFDLKSAFYSGIISAGSFALHVTDPPSLLPKDISKHARLLRPGKLNDRSTVQIARNARAEFAHLLNRRGARRASKVIVMTQKIQRELGDLYGIDAHVIRPGVSIDGSVHDTSRAATPFRMLSVARLVESKRIDWILYALAELKLKPAENHANWTLQIVGEGPASHSLKILAHDLGLADRTIFMGHLEEEELKKAYSQASLFIMPALQGYGLPALEAIKRGIPAVVHKDSGVSEILMDNPWVEIFDGNKASLSQAIRRMLTRFVDGILINTSEPRVPTSSEWAKTVCSELGWIPLG
jgi:glycosyltransferase involved in cell wall biosynthesis